MRIQCFFVSCYLLLSVPGTYAQETNTVIYKDTVFIAAILQQQNTYRTALRLPPLVWSSALATDALAWARHLAEVDKGTHDLSVRGKEGENLWWGSAGKFTYTEMVSYWGNEQQFFQYGTFPDCQTSKSAVVGHYTQMIWRNTTSVGCALAGNGKTDYLVCRYSPPGNIIGQKPY